MTTSLIDIIKNRRTIHHFTPDAVPDEYITKALSLAVYAPNHHHTQPVKFYQFGPETKDNFLQYAAISFSDRDSATAEKKLARWQNIPGWVLVTRKIAESEKVNHEDYATLSIALYIVMQSLTEDGIGSKWSTGSLLFTKEVYALLNIDPQSEVIEGMLWYGYPEKMPLPFPKPLPTEYITKLN